MKSLAAIPDKAWSTSISLDEIARTYFGLEERAYGNQILLGDGALRGIVGVAPVKTDPAGAVVSNLFGLVLSGDQVLFKEGPIQELMFSNRNTTEQYIKLEKAMRKKVAKIVEENQPKAEPISLPSDLLGAVAPDFNSFQIPESVTSQAEIKRLSDKLSASFAIACDRFLRLIKDPVQNSLIRIEMPSRILIKKTKIPVLKEFMDKVATPYTNALEKIKGLQIVKKEATSPQKDPKSVLYFSKETGDKILSVLKAAVVDRLHKQIVDFYFDSKKQRFEEFLTLIQDENAVLEKRFRQEEREFNKYRYGKSVPLPDSEKERIRKTPFLQNFSAILGPFRPYFKEPRLSTETIPNVDEKITQEAEQIAKDMEQTYLSKQVGKIAPIVEKRKDYKEAKVLGASFYRGTIEADVRLTFENGDAFTAHTIIVDVTNQFGTRFFRYPTTFHDVKIGDKTLKRTDEDWMNSHFINGGKQPQW